MLSSLDPRQQLPSLIGRALQPSDPDPAQGHASAGRHGDRVDLSDGARRLAKLADTLDRAEGDSLPSNAPFAAANGMIHKALNAIQRDMGKLLRGFGLSGDLVHGLLKTVIDPVKVALKSGLDFTAQIVMVAARQTTLISDSGMSSSFSLVAKSLSIEVNHTTGEMSLSLGSLQIQETSQIDFSGTPEAIGQLDGPGLDLGQLLGGPLGGFLGGPLGGDDPEGQSPLLEALLAAMAGAGETSHSFDPAATRFLVQALESFENAQGELISRLLLDAIVALTPPEETPEETPEDLPEGLPGTEVGDDAPLTLPLTT